MAGGPKACSTATGQRARSNRGWKSPSLFGATVKKRSFASSPGRDSEKPFLPFSGHFRLLSQTVKHLLPLPLGRERGSHIDSVAAERGRGQHFVAELVFAE